MYKVIENLALRTSEGYLAPSVKSDERSNNLFHRPVFIRESNDIAYIIGLATTGLRVIANIDGENILSNYQAINYCCRTHLPLVINISNHKGEVLDYLKVLQNMGCFIFIARTPQESVNLNLIAQKIAETALVPGIIVSNFDASHHAVSFPDQHMIKEFLGNPDDHIVSPTPSQAIIFGKHRRRIPNWFNLDVPVMFGVRKSGQDYLFEKVASQKYFLDHLPELISQTIKEYNSVFGNSIKLLSTNDRSAANVIITVDQHVKNLYNKISKDFKDIQLVTPTLLSPFPVLELEKLVKGSKTVTVLENTESGSTDGSFLSQIIQRSTNISKVRFYRGVYGSDINEDTITKTFENIIAGETPGESYLGFDFTRKSSEYPTHEVLLQEINDKYPNLSHQTINKRIEPSLKQTRKEDVPLSLRLFSDKGPLYSRLSRFYNHTAFFYNDKKEELVADPFCSIPLIPPSTAEMFTFSEERKLIPEIDLNNCSGKGDSVLLCPHTALLPIVASVEQLIKSGISIATDNGTTFTHITPLVKNLSKVSIGVIKGKNVQKINDFLSESFDKLTTQMQLPKEKKSAAKQELEKIIFEIGDFPVTRTSTFFDEPNAVEPGTGELFSMVLNPRTCTGCSICSHIEDALSMVPQTEESLSKADILYNIWQNMPDTSAKTINRLVHDENYDSLAALSLGRNYLLSMTGGNKYNEHDPQKTVFHLLTTSIETVTQSRMIKYSADLENTINELSEKVHHEISQLLPKENLESITQSLQNTDSKKILLRDVLDQIPGSEQKAIDTVSLKRKTGLIDDLKQLREVLLNGPTGQGRSRYSMVLSGKTLLKWAGQYPVNHFNVPVVIDWNDAAPEQVLGLFHGQMRNMLDNIKLVRRAVLELGNKYEPDQHDIEIANLAWNDLSEEEKSIFAPLLLVAEWNDLNSTGWGNLNSLVSTSYPVKVVVFESITGGKHAAVDNYNKLTAGLLSTIALKKPIVFQGGISDTQHLFNGLRDCIERTGSALINLYYSDLNNHGITNTDWKPYAQLALDSRAFPSVSYDPEQGGSIYGTVKLDGNRDFLDDWVTDHVATDDSEMEYKITWADWAFTQPEWRSEFTSTETGDANIPIASYIELDDGTRKSKTPVIIRESSDGLIYYAVSDEVIQMTSIVLKNWRTLQEMAGVKAEIPAKLKTELSFELENEKVNEIARLKQEHEQQLRDLETSQAEIIRQQLKDKLVSLARSARKNN